MRKREQVCDRRPIPAYPARSSDAALVESAGDRFEGVCAGILNRSHHRKQSENKYVGCRARLRGTGARKPILLLGHLDVVEAKREDWDFDPFKLQEVEGFFRGRGAIDDKSMVAIFVANLVEYIKEGFKPDRDIILALTADEELVDTPHVGARVLVEQHRDLIDAELAINEGGGAALRDGKPFRMSVQHAEKIYQTYVLEVTDRGGHSAWGRRDNAISRLAEGSSHCESRGSGVTRPAAVVAPGTSPGARPSLSGFLTPTSNRSVSHP